MPTTNAILQRRTVFAVADLRAYFEGAWRVARLIADRRADRCGRFIGTAYFTAAKDGLVYEEKGGLRFGDWRGPAWQAYAYDFEQSAPSAVTVRFLDGRLFHAFDLATGHAEVAHACGDDRYSGEITALGSDAFETRWEILGPRKEQTIRTRYRRLTPP